MRKLFLLFLTVTAITLFGSGSSPHSGAGGGGADTGAIARDNTRPPTADIGWSNNALLDAGSVELDDGTDSVTLRPAEGNSTDDGLMFDFGAGGDNYVVAPAFGSSMIWQNNIAGTFAFINIIAKDDDGTDSTGFSACAKSGVSGNPVECLNNAYRHDVGSGVFRIDVSTFGGGSVSRPLEISARNWTSEPGPNLSIETEGSVVFGDGTTGTTKTGPHFFVGSTAGLPTGTPGISPSGRIALNYDTTNDQLCAYNGSWGCAPMANPPATLFKNLDFVTAGNGDNDVRTLTVADDTLTEVTFVCVALADDGSEGMSSKVIGTYRKDGAAALTQLGVTVLYVNQDCGAGANACVADIQLGAATNEIDVVVNGSAGPTSITWDCTTEVRTRAA